MKVAIFSGIAPPRGQKTGGTSNAAATMRLLGAISSPAGSVNRRYPPPAFLVAIEP
jgi:hypothetical protein